MELNEITAEVKDLNQQAALLIKANNVEGAKKKLDKAIELDPMYAESYKNYGDLYMFAENYKEAKNQYKKAVLIEKNGAFYFLYGNACFMNDEVHEGLENYNLAISSGYDSDEMMFFMGMAYEHLNDDQMALRYFQKACVKNPSRPDYIVKKITTELRLEMIDSAEADTDVLLKTAPELFDGYHLKTRILMHKEKYDEAVEFSKAASEKFPEDADLRYDYIRSVAMTKNFNLALKLIDNAAQMKYYEASKHAFILLKAEIYAENNEIDEALKCCEECISMETEEFFNGEARFMAMNLYLAGSDYIKTLDCANALVSNNAEDMYYFAALYYKAFCLKQINETEQSDKAHKEANSIYRLYTLEHPEAVDVYLYRAMVLKDIEQFDKALEILEFIEGLGLELAEIYVVKADIFEAQGKKSLADENREKAFKLKPELRPEQEGE